MVEKTSILIATVRGREKVAGYAFWAMAFGKPHKFFVSDGGGVSEYATGYLVAALPRGFRKVNPRSRIAKAAEAIRLRRDRNGITWEAFEKALVGKEVINA